MMCGSSQRQFLNYCIVMLYLKRTTQSEHVNGSFWQH